MIAGEVARAGALLGELGAVFLARAHYLFNWGPELAWRGDRISAGGGALLELAYHPIDLLVSMLGVPDEVYGVSARPTRSDVDDPTPVYNTEDTAAAILRYADGPTATVVTTRSSGPLSEELALHGRGGSITASRETCVLRDADGNVLDRIDDDIKPVTLFARQADAFARAVATGAKHYACSGWENLLNLAVIEAIYLSDRTSQPEHPQKLLHPHGLGVAECLQHRPGPGGCDDPSEIEAQSNMG